MSVLLGSGNERKGRPILGAAGGAPDGAASKGSGGYGSGGALELFARVASSIASFGFFSTDAGDLTPGRDPQDPTIQNQ